jgi:multidrug efflux system outer membrane protein
MHTKISTITGALAFLFIAGGCTFEPPFERATPPVPATFPLTTSTHAQAPAAADIGWRDFIGEPRLQVLVALALKNNRDLQVALLHVEAAQAQYQIAKLAFLPTLDATAAKSTSRTPRDLLHNGHPQIASDYSVGGQSAWQIDLFGRALSLKHEALADYFAVAQNRKAAQITLIAAVANLYVLLQATDAQIDVTRETIRIAEETLRLTKLRFDSGISSDLDVQQAQTIVAIADATLQAQLAARARCANGLTLLVGEPLPYALPAARPLADQEFLSDIPAGVPSDLLERRPDVIAAEQSLIAANADIGTARAAFFPSVSLTSSLGTESPELRGLFRPGSLSWGYAPQINLPIFQGGQLRASLDLSKVRRQIQVTKYEKAIQNAFREVADGLAARSTYAGQVQHLAREVDAQDRRLELATLRYRQGVESEFAVLQAQQQLYATQQQLIAAREERLTNLVDLYRYLGGGWVEHTGDQPLPADS